MSTDSPAISSIPFLLDLLLLKKKNKNKKNRERETDREEIVQVCLTIFEFKRPRLIYCLCLTNAV